MREEEQLLAVMTQARELLTEVRQATKDLKAAKREVNDLLRLGVTQEVNALVEDKVRRALEELGTVTKAEMAKSVAKVAREFDRLEALFLGTENDDKPSIEELIRRRKGLT